jgi:hypothetical protein
MKKKRLTAEKLNEIPHDILVSMHLQLMDSFDVVISQNDELIKKVSSNEPPFEIPDERFQELFPKGYTRLV